MRYGNLKGSGMLAVAVGSLLLVGCADDASVVGEWNYIESGVVVQRQVFDADGTFSHEVLGPDGALHPYQTGTFSVEGDQLTTTAAYPEEGQLRLASTFYVDDEHFARIAMLPVGEVDGLVGTWHLHVQVDNLSEENDSTDIEDATLTLAADGVVQLEISNGASTRSYDQGSYAYDDLGRLHIEASNGGDSRTEMNPWPLEGAALSVYEIFTRQ